MRNKIMQILTLISLAIIVGCSTNEINIDIVDCGMHEEVVKFMPNIEDLEDNPTLKCLGRNILNGCNKAYGIISVYDVGTVKYELLGGSNERCTIQIEFDQIPEQTEVSTNINLTIYSETDFQCDISLDMLKKVSAATEFDGEPEKITPGFFAYEVYNYAFLKVRETASPFCKGSAVEKTNYSMDQDLTDNLMDKIRELEGEAEQEKIKKEIERQNNPSNIVHCGTINNMHIFSLPEERTDDEKDAISCFNENLLDCNPVTFDIVGVAGSSYEIKTKQGDFCLIDDGNKTCKIPVSFILESTEAAKTKGKPEFAFLSISICFSYGKVTNMDTKEEIIIECD